MARSLALFLLIASALCVRAQDTEGACPIKAPSQSSSTTCETDTGCPDTQKCCLYSNSKRCVIKVVPNFSATLYFVNMTVVNQETSHLSTFVEGRFSSIGNISELEVERLGNCMKVKLQLQETKEHDGEAEEEVTSLEQTPVNVNKFSGGPFQVTSGLDSAVCPEAVPTFHAQFHILNVNDTVKKSVVKDKIMTLIGNQGGGWDYGAETIGGCLKVTLEAVLTSEEEGTVATSLSTAETGGITLVDGSPPFPFTSNNEEASVCYQDFVQSGCSQGHRMCSYLQKCVAEEAFCDGKDDCGNNGDEDNCNCEEREGFRPCANRQFCLMDRFFCDSERHCEDGSDEEGCNFEVYTMRLQTRMKWSSDLDNKNSFGYKLLANTTRTSLINQFLSLRPGFAYVTVLEITNGAEGNISVEVSVTFSGELNAKGVREEEKNILANGFSSGMFSMSISNVTQAKPGRCGDKDCGGGLCVEVEDKAACRCLPGQDLDSCQPMDCRGSENYCGNSSIRCMKVGHLSGFTCECPSGWTGQHCDIEVCGQLGDGVCGMFGQCLGNLFNFSLCACGDQYFGPFCENRGDATLSPCVVHSQLHLKFLQHLMGEGQQNADLLNGYTMADRLQSLGIYNLQVPGCDANKDYEHICVYNTSNHDFNMCYCTHPNGTYNGTDYVDGVCREPSAFDPEEKAGICPPVAEAGVTTFECRYDTDCPAVDKCCRAGVGRVCKAPYTVKDGECPAPQPSMTAWMCDSDGDCSGHHKCCREDKARICRPPVYVTRFQINVTLSAEWKQKFSNVYQTVMVELGNALKNQVDDMIGFQSCELVYAMPDDVFLKVVVEVVGDPEVRTPAVMDCVDSLKDFSLLFDGVQRLVSQSILDTHEFCGSAGCGTGICLNSTRGTHCLCPQNVYGDRCQFMDPCEGGVCQNGGVCESSRLSDGSAYNYTCHCPQGYRGSTCQVSVCAQFPAEICNSGTCVGDLRRGVLCSCPLTARGVFCENNGTEVPYTECELRHRLNSRLADVLKGKTSIPGGVSAQRLREIFSTLATDWLPLVTCQHDGRYVLTSELLSVGDGSTVRYACLDRQGQLEDNCQSKVCSALSTGPAGGSLCQNGGRCVGNIHLQLCNCSGTGHHGALCTQQGEDDLTQCEHQHELVQVALDALGDSLEVGGQTSTQVKTLVSTLLQDIHLDILWQPDCTQGGSHAYRGCEYRVSDSGIQECYCVDKQLERITSISGSTSGLPECPLSGACGEFSSNPCGDHGTCRGDVNAGILCQCQEEYSGMTCDVNAASTMTECQRRSELSTFILSVLHGYKEAPPLLKTSMNHMLQAAGLHRLEVPTCTNNDAGVYKFICTYEIDPVSLDECRCTNDDGTYKGGEDGGATCNDLAKPGECPLSEGGVGITVHECSTDFSCQDSQKCCSIGSGRQCGHPVYVASFRVNVTIDAPWKSTYSNLMSSNMASIRSQLEGVFRPMAGFRSVTLVFSQQGSVKVTIDVMVSADITMEDMDNGVSRLKTYQLNVEGSTHRVTQAVFTPISACIGAMKCGTGVCVDTSLGAMCVCREGTSGDRCQHIMVACNCSEGQQCLRGTKDGTVVCSCYPEKDAACKLPPWFCEGRADCGGNEKCVHQEQCNSQSACEIQSSCILKAESHSCDDQPCQHGGLCVIPAQGSSPYQCRCKAGFTGLHCETNAAICQLVPKDLCTDSCVGDVHMGVLCKCPFGRGGLNCDQPAHSHCERQSTFFSDLRKAWRRELTVPGVTKTQLYNLATHLAQETHTSTLPSRTCNSDGNFSPVQCALNLTTEEESCQCVSKEGFPRQSNVDPYPGFPACTASYSPDQLGQALCATSLGKECGQGGRCVGNLLNGTLCLCAQGKTGLLCRVTSSQAQEWESPGSLCELSREVWKLMREATLNNDHGLLAPLQTLQAHLFHASTASPDVMIRAACLGDGRFEPVQCAYHLRTEQPTHCYCISPKGVLLETKTAWPQQPQCDDVKSCPGRACLLACEHGLADDIHGCPICQCRHPCDGQCEHDPGRRCLVELLQDCGRENWEGTCTSGVCRDRQKSGMCPVSVAANMTAVQTLKSHDISTCDVTCLDDADCPDDDKCCGVCGAHCVQSTGEYTCTTHRTSALAELKLLKAVHTALERGEIRTEWASRLVRAKLDSLRAKTRVWVPECQSNGFYELTQCYSKVTTVGTNTVVDGCFCVDPQGDVIHGTDADTKAKASCDAKPGNCPFLQPNTSAAHGCSNDFDCQADLKCCPDGLGSLCVPPLKPKEGEAFSLDEVIANLCQFGREECGLNGRCAYHWFTEGRVCICNSGYKGPLCQTQGNEESGMTPCKRRKEMVDLLIKQPTLLNLFLQRARGLGATGVIKLTMPQCLTDGQFQVTQCSENVDTRHKVDCFCVNRQGGPLGGTNVPYGQTPACSRLNPCTQGAPLHHMTNGSAVVCGAAQGQCVKGYACQAGRYGDFYCCRDFSSNVDVCLLPPSPGKDCQYYQGQQEVTQPRFYFDAASRQCKSVTYTGCSDVKPNFPSKAACESRCVRKEHAGQCPSRTVVAERVTCSDVCSSDAQCQEDQKCCVTSCGRRCVLALNTGQAVCEMGQPLTDPMTQKPLQCSTDADCGVGYYCRNSRCCIKRLDDICQQKQLAGQCNALRVRYHYDADAKQCQQFTFSGCGANDNNFPTKYHCCNACAGRRGRCKEGMCPVPHPVLSVSCDHSCLGDGDCPANLICCNTSCGGSTCMNPKAPTEEPHSCRDDLIEYTRQLINSQGCFLAFRPRCDSSGNWQRQQCSDKLGVCWCVTPKGHVLPRTRVRGVAQCQWVTSVTMAEADRVGRRGNDQVGEQCQVCPGGGPVQCCNEDLCLQVCAAHPEAVCRINPCGGCRAEFYNVDNQIVDCSNGASTCQINRQKAYQARDQHNIIALATHNRQKNVSPRLMTSMDGKTQKLFIVSGVPQKCQLMPDSGSCKAHTPYWFYNVTSERCDRFVYGLCGGNDNRFPTADDCYQQCKASASPCHGSKCSSGQRCRLTHPPDCFTGPCTLTAQCTASAGSHEVSGVHVPRCTEDGQFDPMQCGDGLCWCVNQQTGNFNGAITSNPASLKCNPGGPANGNYAKIKCPDSSCVDKCRDARCSGVPDARCVLDLCTCTVRFVNRQGNAVNCAGDKCNGNAFMKAENNCPYGAVCGGKGSSGCEYVSRCAGAVCANNPCAVCQPDPCTATVGFLDTLTRQPVSAAHCNQVTHTSCELRQCEVTSHNARANGSLALKVSPQCLEDGSYKPQQRAQDNSLHCVDAFGLPANTTDQDSSECEIDPVVTVDLAVVYEGDYDSIVTGKRDKIVKAFKGALVDVGIPEPTITNVQVGRGSIVLSTTIVRHSDFPLDLAVIRPLVQFRALSGAMTLRVEGVELRVVRGEGGVMATSVTASQLAGPDNGLSGGAIAGIVIFMLLLAGGVAGGLAFYFLYYKRRMAERDGNGNPYPTKGQGEGEENRTFTIFTVFTDLLARLSPQPPPEDFVEERMEDHYVKVRP